MIGALDSGHRLRPEAVTHRHQDEVTGAAVADNLAAEAALEAIDSPEAGPVLLDLFDRFIAVGVIGDAPEVVPTVAARPRPAHPLPLQKVGRHQVAEVV